MKRIRFQIDCMAVAVFLLLYVIAFAISPQYLRRFKKETSISCGPLQAVNEHHSWPSDDNSGNGCTHQTVSAALLGRVKRDKPHGC